MSEDTISRILERIEYETGIVLSRSTDRSRIRRYLDSGGAIPNLQEPLPEPLVNLVTTNETYFEREQHHFNRLMEEILPELDRLGDSAKAIRILCAPSSSGEEPYTIALRIQESAQKFRRPIEIIGVDISSEAIGRAQLGLFSERSVHALNTKTLEHYFIHEEQGYRIRPLSGVNVQFRVGNLFDSRVWGELGYFDVIFSRNMMIYFDKSKNRELLERFKSHLRGYLILGHADDHSQARELFTPLRFERGVIYRT